MMMARSLVDVSTSVTGKVRLMNPFDQEAVIRQNSVLGEAELLDEETEVMSYVSMGEPEGSLGVPQGKPEEGMCTLAGNVAHNLSGTEIMDTQTIDNTDEDKVREDKDLGTSVTVQRISSANSSIPEHLRDMYLQAVEGKTPEDKQVILDTIKRFADVFSRDDTDLGRTHLTVHEIPTGDAPPVKQPPRRVPMALVHEEREAIENLKRQGVIRESNSPWASPILLVRKKNGKIRPCVDYRRVNSLTCKDAYPIPRIQDCLDAMAGSVMFSTLDMTSGYHQIPIKEGDIPKTAFVTRQGLYEFTTMPFGLTNAPATFQRVMEVACRGLQWSSCLIYLDDVLIFGKTPAQHAQRLQLVLERIRMAGLKLKPEKCELFQTEVRFLGHIVSAEGVLPDPSNTSKIRDWPVPRNVTEVRQFLGLCSYYRRFVRNFSILAKPLSDLTCKDSELVWNSTCQQAFDELKAKLTGPEITAFPRDDCPFLLDTDACDTGIGAVLSQVQAGQERVVAYASRSLNRAERNYCVTDKELLAVRYFVEYFRHYLLGRQFCIRTDHQALKWLFSLREPKGRIARWIEILSAYQFSIEYRPGKKHGNADGLSRCPNPRDCQCPEVDNLESLRCGPCSKCRKRSQDMYLTENSEERAQLVQVVDQEAMASPVNLEGTGNSPEDESIQQVPQDSHLVVKLILLLGTLWYWLTSWFQWMAPQPSFLWLYDWQPCGEPEFPGGVDMIASENYTDDGRLWPKLGGRWLDQAKKQVNRVLKLDRGSQLKTQIHKTTDLTLINFSTKELHQKQMEDKDLGLLMKWKLQGTRPHGSDVTAASPELRHYWNYWLSVDFDGGVLYKRAYTDTGVKQQLLVPHSLRKELVDKMHNSVFGSHLGTRKTIDKLQQRHYWYNMRDDVKIWVKQCDICAANKWPKRKFTAPLGDMRTGAPMDRLGIDIMGPLPLSHKGNQYIQMVTDSFTKWVEIQAIPDQTAATCAEHLVDAVICRLGCPLSLHSDQGRNYESKLFMELCKLLEIRKTRTTPRRPQCNGQTERFNRTMVQMIRAFIKGEQRDWDLYLPCLAAAYRSSKHETTGFSPNFLMLGREVRLPGDITPPKASSSPLSDPADYIEKLRERLTIAHDLTRKHLKGATERHRDIYDAKTNHHLYKPGDLVWYLNEVRREGMSPKLQPTYTGPHLILNNYNNIDYLMQKANNTKPVVIHHNKLKPYEGNASLKWAQSALKKYKTRATKKAGWDIELVILYIHKDNLFNWWSPPAYNEFTLFQVVKISKNSYGTQKIGSTGASLPVQRMQVEGREGLCPATRCQDTCGPTTLSMYSL